MRTGASVVAVAAALAGAVLWGAEPAQAAQGYVPPAVSEFVSSQLVARLDRTYGVAAGGTVDLRAATPGPIIEVYFFTEDARAGRDTDDPVVPRDEWVVPVDVGGLPVGAAVLSLTSGGANVHIESWSPGAPFAASIALLGPTAQLVRDLPTSSWFSVEKGIATPIVTGTSQVVRPRALSALALDRVPPQVDGVNPGTVRALATLVALVGLALLAVSIPRLIIRRRSRNASPPGP